jgi:hypothetical protein
MKNSVKAALAGAAIAAGVGLVTASPAQASTETIFVCPDGFTGVAEGHTSCAFAHNVGVGVYTQGLPIVQAYSPVTDEVYTTQCGAGFEVYLNTGRTVNADRCVGGNNAVVWVW